MFIIYIDGKKVINNTEQIFHQLRDNSEYSLRAVLLQANQFIFAFEIGSPSAWNIHFNREDLIKGCFLLGAAEVLFDQLTDKFSVLLTAHDQRP